MACSWTVLLGEDRSAEQPIDSGCSLPREHHGPSAPVTALNCMSSCHPGGLSIRECNTDHSNSQLQRAQHPRERFKYLGTFLVVTTNGGCPDTQFLETKGCWTSWDRLGISIKWRYFPPPHQGCSGKVHIPELLCVPGLSPPTSNSHLKTVH